MTLLDHDRSNPTYRQSFHRRSSVLPRRGRQQLIQQRGENEKTDELRRKYQR